MRKAIKSFAISALLLATMFSHAGSTPEVPAWVSQAASEKLATYDAETKAVVLLDSTEIVVENASSYVETFRRAVRILRPEGKSEREFGVHLASDDKLIDVHAWTLDAAQKPHEVKAKEFALFSPYSEEMYSDVRFYTANAPAAEVGSVVAFEYSVRRHAWMTQLHWSVQEDLPLHEARFTLELPAKWEYSVRWANDKAAEPVSTGANRWTWTKRDVPAIDDESMRPARISLGMRMELAYFAPSSGGPTDNFASWDAIGRWYSHLTEERLKPSPELAAKAQQLTGGASSFDAKLRAIASFLQHDVRYVAVEIGIGGFQPHAASDVFRHRYGDCKDKATLLIALLAEVGIRGHYVIVHTTNDFVKADVPSTWFNHAIAAIEIPADVPEHTYPSEVRTSDGTRLLIFDPTSEQTPVGMLNPSLQGSFGLFVDTNKGEAIRLPLLAPEQNRLERAAKFTLAPDFSLSGTVVERRTGANASNFRSQLRAMDAAERTQYLERAASRSRKQTVVTQNTIDDLDQNDRPVVVKYDVTLPGYAQQAGGLALVRPRVIGDKAISVDRKKPRKYPVRLHSTEYSKDVFEIVVPAGYVIDEVPDPVKVDVGFASYSSKVEVEGQTLRYTREYTIREPLVELSKVKDFYRLHDAIMRDESASAVLKLK